MNSKLEKLKKGLGNPFRNIKSASFTLLVSFFSLIAMSLSGSLIYTKQMFSYGVNYWIPAIQTRLTGILIEGGLLGLSTSLIYSLLIGITIINLITQIRFSGIDLRSLSGIGPGFIAAGCAGCGVGLLSIVGLSGLLAFLPLQGESIRMGGYYCLHTL